MANKFLAFLAAAGKDTVHVVEEAPKIAVAVGKALADGAALGPDVKTQIQDVMAAVEQVAIVGGGAAAAEGKNIVLDAAVVPAVQNLIKVFLVAYPVIQKAVGVEVKDIEAAVEAAK